MKIYKKGKLRSFKLNILNRFRDGKNAQSSLRNQTHSAVVDKNKIPNQSIETTDAYVSSTAISRINAELEKHSMGSRKVSPDPENNQKVQRDNRQIRRD